MYNIDSMNGIGHTKWMGAEWLPMKIMEWFIPGRRGRSRPQTWINDVQKIMHTKGIVDQE